MPTVSIWELLLSWSSLMPRDLVGTKGTRLIIRLEERSLNQLLCSMLIILIPDVDVSTCDIQVTIPSPSSLELRRWRQIKLLLTGAYDRMLLLATVVHKLLLPTNHVLQNGSILWELFKNVWGGGWRKPKYRHPTIVVVIFTCQTLTEREYFTQSDS